MARMRQGGDGGDGAGDGAGGSSSGAVAHGSWLVAMCHTLPAMTRSMTRRGFLSAPMNEAGSYNIGRGRWQEVRVGAWSTWLVVAGFNISW